MQTRRVSGSVVAVQLARLARALVIGACSLGRSTSLVLPGVPAPVKVHGQRVRQQTMCGMNRRRFRLSRWFEPVGSVSATRCVDQSFDFQAEHLRLGAQ
jgi:hypothetical protein